VQQRQIIRIVLLVPLVALFSFLIVWQEGAGTCLFESLDFGCAIALSAFLQYLGDYVLSHPDEFDEIFGEGVWQRGQLAKDSPQWLKVLPLPTEQPNSFAKPRDSALGTQFSSSSR
jgi:hypothetical protein